MRRVTSRRIGVEERLARFLDLVNSEQLSGMCEACKRTGRESKWKRMDRIVRFATIIRITSDLLFHSISLTTPRFACHH